MLCPGPYATSWTITNICLYYFVNMTCLCEPITILPVRIGHACYVYMEHAIEGAFEVI